MRLLDFWFGVACCVALATTSIGRRGPRRRRDIDDTRFAAVLLVVWYAGVLIHMAEDAGLISDMAGDFASPPMDLLTGAAVALAAWRRPAPWKRALFVLVAAQMCAHVAFGLSDKGHAAQYGYALGLNITFALELLCLCWPGVTHGLSATRGRRPSSAGGLRSRLARHRA